MTRVASFVLLAATLLGAAAGGAAQAGRATLAIRMVPARGDGVARAGWRPGPASDFGRHGGLHRWRRDGHGFAAGYGGAYGGGYGGLGYGGLGYGGLGYGGGLVDDPETAGRDDGFFTGRAEARVEGGEAAYDYDRSYPYDWYREPSAQRAGRPMRHAAVAGTPSPVHLGAVHCSVEHGSRGAVVRVCRGGD